MCQPRGIQEEALGYDCGCCRCGPPFRRFISTEEELETLKEYKNQLEKELAGVEEYIQELKSE